MMSLLFGKRALAAAAVVSVVALGGVGFASWYVSGPSEYNFTGNVQVEGVVGDIANVTVPQEQLNQSVYFTAPAEAIDNTSCWLYAADTVEQNLTLEYSFTFTGVTSASALILSVEVADSKSNQTYTFSDGSQKAASYAAAVEAGYIADISDVGIEVDLSQNSQSGHISFASADNSFTFDGLVEEYLATVTITFAWGSAFGGENPYYKYRDLEGAEERIAAADTLAYIAACLSGVQYSIVFTPVSV